MSSKPVMLAQCVNSTTYPFTGLLSTMQSERRACWAVCDRCRLPNMSLSSRTKVFQLVTTGGSGSWIRKLLNHWDAVPVRKVDA